MSSYAALLQRSREKAGVSKLDLAFRTGLTEADISAFECGLREPTPLAVQKLAAALGLSGSHFASALARAKGMQAQNSD
jgi:transcriptional regulator with XRE-family HTH domain